MFVTPNITPDRQYGIGGWSELEFVNAMKRGVGRHGEHLYPAFPYSAYSLMHTADVRDLFAYLKTLPAVARPTAPHELGFPYSLRPAVGFWKLLYFHPHDFAPDAKQSAAWNRGAYLAEGPAHCAECHTPRGALGGPKLDKLYAGAPNLESRWPFRQQHHAAQGRPRRLEPAGPRRLPEVRHGQMLQRADRHEGRHRQHQQAERCGSRRGSRPISIRCRRSPETASTKVPARAAYPAACLAARALIRGASSAFQRTCSRRPAE